MANDPNTGVNQDISMQPESHFVCRKCHEGHMEAAVEANELELTDTFICDHCGHKAIIPSMLIIASQLLCGVGGGVIAGFLFIQEMASLVTAFQFHLQRDIANNSLLVTLSLLFLVGFGYTLYNGFLGLTVRRLYLGAAKNPPYKPAMIKTPQTEKEPESPPAKT